MANATEDFERRAEEFKRDMGMHAPGKDVMFDETPYHIRVAAWAGWNKITAERDRARTEADNYRSRLESAERERDYLAGRVEAYEATVSAMRPVVAEAQHWYHSMGDDHALGREVPRYENLTKAQSPSNNQGKTNG